MRNANAVKQLFHTLAGLQGNIALFARGIDDLLLSHGYPSCHAELEAARGGLDDLGLYEELKDILASSEALVREGKYDDAEMLILDVNRKLSKASGVEDDLHRMSTPPAS